MNCKQGDLAIVVCSVSSNEGKIVRCVKLHTLPHGFDADGRWQDQPIGARWVIEPTLPVDRGDYSYTIADAYLRPIRGTEGQDEMLRIAGVPATVLR